MVANSTAVRSISGAFKRSAGGARTRVYSNIFDSSSGFNARVWSIAIDADNKVICGGEFTSYAGTACNFIARINIDGSLDSTFAYGSGFNAQVRSVKLDNDGKILCAGGFSAYDGSTRNRLARINTDGSVDTGFDAGTTLGNIFPSRGIALDSNNKIYTTGNTGAGENLRVFKFDTDGTLDTSFNNYLFDDNVNALAIDSDNKVICGGEFTSFNGTARQYIARLNTDGTIDTSFDSSSGFNNGVSAIIIDSNGNIVCGGAFTSYDGTTRQRIAMLDEDANVDTAFDSSSGFSSSVICLHIQSNGKILCGGAFTSYDGTTRQKVARLNTDASIDASFDSSSGFNGAVWSIGQTASSKVVCGGDFTDYDGTTRQRIARLNTDASIN